MNGVAFKRKDGALGRRKPGEDHISMLFVEHAADQVEDPISGWSDTDFADAVALTPALGYHVSEFYRMAGRAKLIIVETSTTFSVADIKDLVYAQGGVVRQIGIAKMGTTQTSVYLNSLQEKLEELYDLNMPASAVVSFHTPSGTIDTIADLRALNNHRLSVVVSQDSTGYGSAIQDGLGSSKTLGSVGTLLGVIAGCNVNEAIFEVATRNLTPKVPYFNGTYDGNSIDAEFDAPLVFGESLNDLTVAQIQQVDEYGYILMRKHVAQAGTYFNDSHTAIALSSDYAYLENNRVADKADRIIYKTVVLKVGSNVGTDPEDGTITEDSAASIEAILLQAIDDEMKGEISGASVTVDREQKPIQDGKLKLSRKVVVNGILRNIEVESSLALSI